MLRARENRALLNAIRHDPHSGQKEPRILRQFNVLDFYRIEMLSDVPKCQCERTGNRLLRRITHAASLRRTVHP